MNKGTVRELTEAELQNMKHYKCHKEVDATPMTRGEYNLYRGWQIPENENPSDLGYLVIYNKGKEDHYESWLPKKQLEEGYSVMED